MKMWKNWRSTLREEGYLTLQVPQFARITLNHAPNIELVDVPDEWFWSIKDDRPAVGKERGFLHISPAGYAANKESIAQAYLDAVEDESKRRPLSPREYKALPSLAKDEYVCAHGGGQNALLRRTPEAFDAWANNYFEFVRSEAERYMSRASCPDHRREKIGVALARNHYSAN